MKKSLYIGCSLTHASDQYRKEMKKIANSLRGTYEVLELMNMTIPAEHLIKEDIKLLEKADMRLFFADQNSTGVGIEMGYCLAKQLPMTIALKKGGKYSDMILGLGSSPHVIVWYDNIMEITN